MVECKNNIISLIRLQKKNTLPKLCSNNWPHVASISELTAQF